MSTEVQAEELFQVQGAPDIPGIRFRRMRGESDFAVMVEVLNASNRADGSERIATMESIRANYANLRNSDAEKDVVIVEVNGEVVGYKRVFWTVETDGKRVYSHFGFMKPQWRGKGIGTALIRHSEARLREISSDHPDTGPRYFSTGSSDKQVQLNALLASEGYKIVRYGYDMLRPTLDNIPNVPLPEGIEVRPVMESDLPAIFEAEQEAFLDHWGAEEPQEGDYERWKNESLFQPQNWSVGWDTATGEVAGMVRGFINAEENEEFGRKRGYTENISVRRPWRRKGLARALMVHNMHLQKKLEMTETALGVDAENPSGALNLYKSMGFEVTETGYDHRKEM